MREITLADAADNIGRAVVYQSHPAAPVEQGYITSVNHRYVFVRYGSDSTGKATRPDDLRWMNT